MNGTNTHSEKNFATQKALNSAGFTLIELLIVIVIIGILAGVVIAAINPIQLQNRAKDGTLRSSLNKLALGTKALTASSSVGDTPDPVEFISAVGNVAAGHTCTTVSATSCYFDITGISMSADCGAGGQGTGTTKCFLRYYRPDVDNFRILERNSANPRTTFMYTYTQDASLGTISEGFYSCPGSGNGVVSDNVALSGCTLMTK